MRGLGRIGPFLVECKHLSFVQYSWLLLLPSLKIWFLPTNLLWELASCTTVESCSAWQKCGNFWRISKAVAGHFVSFILSIFIFCVNIWVRRVAREERWAPLLHVTVGLWKPSIPPEEQRKKWKKKRSVLIHCSYLHENTTELLGRCTVGGRGKAVVQSLWRFSHRTTQRFPRLDPCGRYLTSFHKSA